MGDRSKVGCRKSTTCLRASPRRLFIWRARLCARCFQQALCLSRTCCLKQPPHKRPLVRARARPPPPLRVGSASATLPSRRQVGCGVASKGHARARGHRRHFCSRCTVTLTLRVFARSSEGIFCFSRQESARAVGGRGMLSRHQRQAKVARLPNPNNRCSSSERHKAASARRGGGEESPRAQTDSAAATGGTFRSRVSWRTWAARAPILRVSVAGKGHMPEHPIGEGGWGSVGRSAPRSNSAWSRRGPRMSIRASDPPWSGIPAQARPCWRPQAAG